MVLGGKGKARGLIVQYQRARRFIRTGDLIAVKRRGGVLAAATRLVTQSPYTHTGIALWEGERLLLAHTTGAGSHLVPLSHVQHAYNVFRCPVDPEAARSAVWATFGEPIGYDVMDLVRIASHIVLGTKLPELDDEELICSALSARIYQLAGWNPPGLPSIPWPGAIVDALQAPPAVMVSPGRS